MSTAVRRGTLQHTPRLRTHDRGVPVGEPGRDRD
jgi:hypothetical protein